MSVIHYALSIRKPAATQSGKAGMAGEPTMRMTFDRTQERKEQKFPSEVRIDMEGVT